MLDYWGFLPAISSAYSGIFDTLYSILMTDLMMPLSNKFNNVVKFIAPIFKFTVGIFITIFGFLILSGRIKAPAQEFVFRVCTIGLVFFLAFTPSIYEKYFIKPVFGTTTAVTKLISPESEGFFSWMGGGALAVGSRSEDVFLNNRGIFMGLDVSIESVSIIITGTIEAFRAISTPSSDAKATESGSNKPSGGTGGNDKKTKTTSDTGFLNGMLVMGFVGLIITGAVMVFVTAGAILMINHVFLVLLLMIGPAFLAMAAYKPTREYAKRWFSRLLGVGLTIGIVSAMTSFILFIQGDITEQMCKATSSIQESFYNKMQKAGADVGEVRQTVREQMKRDFDALRVRVVKSSATNVVKDLSVVQASEQGIAALQLVDNIIKGCNLGGSAGGGNTGGATEEGTNVMFYAIQFLIICMILNRLLTESANIAAAIVNSSGMNIGTAHEVSGGAQGVTGRAGQGGASGKPTVQH